MHDYRPILFAALLLATSAPALATATTPTDSFVFVSFELGDIQSKEATNGVFTAHFNNASTDTTFTARAGEMLQGSISLPATVNEGNWSIDLHTLAGNELMHVEGVLTSTNIQILGSRVDSTRIDLPRDTTSLRVIKGYVSATVTLVGQLKQAACCTAILGIDANADGNVTTDETQTVAANGTEVRAVIHLDRAAPSVPYTFTIMTADGRNVARASGTYSFTKLNGVSATGEFDPNVVEYVTGSVDRVPHLVQHDIGSSILLQTVTGSERQEDGPRVFFTMGTPSTQAAATHEGTSTATASTTAAPAPEDGPSLGQRILSLMTGPVFLAIVIGSFAAAALAFAARRLLNRTA